MCACVRACMRARACVCMCMRARAPNYKSSSAILWSLCSNTLFQETRVSMRQSTIKETWSWIFKSLTWRTSFLWLSFTSPTCPPFHKDWKSLQTAIFHIPGRLPKVLLNCFIDLPSGGIRFVSGKNWSFTVTERPFSRVSRGAEYNQSVCTRPIELLLDHTILLAALRCAVWEEARKKLDQ